MVDKIGGGSLGANVITVTANTGSIINANSINFNNTSTATISVAQGAGGDANGVANVSISAPGRVSLGLVLALGG